MAAITQKLIDQYRRDHHKHLSILYWGTGLVMIGAALSIVSFHKQ